MDERSFNTDDGIRRAAIYIVEGLSYEAAEGFNTDDGIRRAAIPIKKTVYGEVEGFNTDDGIRRAAIASRRHEADKAWEVSIPMTVLGGLQYCAPEPLGLLAPDE